jgi:hypothetical protein
MSEVKVNKISPRTNCGTTQLGDAGDTITVTGDLKSNSLKSASGSTITLGQSGDTIQLGCGASQTGFGRTGTVDWDTTAKTASFTAVSGNGYFVNTTSGAVTMTLPASPSAGDIVSVKDYAGTFATNNLTIARNGSNLDGSATDTVRSTDNESLTLVYVDGTQGWKSVEEGTGFIGLSFMVATGGTITTCGNCKIHTFTGPGTFCVSSVASCAANNQVSYLIMAGGAGGGAGSGGSWNAGGGGAGGFRESKSPVTPYTASPLISSTPVTVSTTSYPVVVGAGGGTRTSQQGGTGNAGSCSSFGGITSAGGGGGGDGTNPTVAGAAGGSGGGGGSSCGGQPTYPAAGGGGNTPPVSPPQGSSGGASAGSTGQCSAGGGGGAGGNGTNGPGPAVAGGPSVTSQISGGPVAYSQGGSSGSYPLSSTATSASANTGGGGQGAHGANQFTSGAGGSGIVIIRYKYQ